MYTSAHVRALAALLHDTRSEDGRILDTTTLARLDAWLDLLAEDGNLPRPQGLFARHDAKAGHVLVRLVLDGGLRAEAIDAHARVAWRSAIARPTRTVEAAIPAVETGSAA